MPTASDVGARPATWLPTPEEIGSAPSGYGLGTSSISVTDLNTALNCGFFAWGSDCANAPFSYGTGLTINRFNGRYTQVAFNPFMSGCGEICVRSYNGTEWLPWEYVNPPMHYGVEYRTTERYNGQPVYVKAVNYGYIPVGESVIPHGIANIDEVIGLSVINRSYGVFNNSNDVSSAANKTDVIVNTAWAMGGLIYVIKYTKY
jgi:hypothetical protein